ncbi:forespore capture DNA-binding protein RefZ [Aquibacillus sp. 3ASR75-11]|uniref:Forespore capture DNA-binding protein RefZ n=1 Tax=Terrihalobacillus insolitus TaxID=2950438 RepID=A0A9X3WRI8_9BACI|nr:forespore capture DNA-binding protein RefZ [Terrihalobacillus insolitus]MDC3412670.1 forespore capture DNA-binding protein RefZ [Terrihalobacillus insolitus]MDC3424020.1 forespore capture DNA-binding protein RefZ [Terrihalobacillus insolitus]
MKNNETKRKVMDAACRLFYSKGYHGTSVREIAKKATVNVSLINYYFQSKQGLLESAVVHYYEEYLKKIEEEMIQSENLSSFEQLKRVIAIIIQYKQERHQFTCFIQRELTLDSVFVREMMVTYLAKEHYILSGLFEKVLEETHYNKTDRQFYLLQLKGLLNTPYMAPNEWHNKVKWSRSNDLFITKYTTSIFKWIEFVTSVEKEKSRSELS